MSDPTTQTTVAAEDPLVPFILGVTGHMDLASGDMDAVKETVRQTIVWLCPALRRLHSRGEDGPPNPVDGLTVEPLGLTEKTPLVLLSSLAPGADHWVAQVAREYGLRVVAPLPFPREQYTRASTFEPSGPEEPPPGDKQARERYEKKLARWQAEAPERERLARPPATSCGKCWRTICSRYACPATRTSPTRSCARSSRTRNCLQGRAAGSSATSATAPPGNTSPPTATCSS